jgi:amino-acid N-acetyltransferase
MRTATTNDLPAVQQLLEANRLPTAGVQDHLEHYLLVYAGDGLIACAGLELHDRAGLLRSVVVIEQQRSTGLGEKLVRAILEQAKSNHLSSVHLLTETAADYFPRFGFQIVAREALPKSLHASAEFRGACPDSAIAMTLKLEQQPK